jgi:hypothetical protein
VGASPYRYPYVVKEAQVHEGCYLEVHFGFGKDSTTMDLHGRICMEGSASIMQDFSKTMFLEMAITLSMKIPKNEFRFSLCVIRIHFYSLNLLQKNSSNSNTDKSSFYSFLVSVEDTSLTPVDPIVNLSKVPSASTNPN